VGGILIDKMKKTKYLKVYTDIGIQQVGAFKGNWELYEWTDKWGGCWSRPEGQYTQDFFDIYGDKTHIMESFVFGNSIAQIDKEIKKREFVAKHGPKKKKDALIHCPDCNWAFNTPDAISDPDYNSFRDEVCHSIHCLCGRQFCFKVEFEIKVKQVIIK